MGSLTLNLRPWKATLQTNKGVLFLVDFHTSSDIGLRDSCVDVSRGTRHIVNGTRLA